MSTRIVINNFGRGIADDKLVAAPGEFAFSKQFDILTYPRRLKPLRGMTADTTGTSIGNIIVGNDGLMYGVGDDSVSGNAGKGMLWQRSGYGVSDVWQQIPSTSQKSGANVVYDFLVQNPDTGQARNVYWASANILVASDPLGGSSPSTQALTFSTIGQGLVHPKDKYIYFPYKTSSAHYIGIIPPNATVWTGLLTGSSGFTLPFTYRAYCLSHYGNYLAIPLTSSNGIGVNGSIVALWGRDTSQTTFDEIIPWGAGNLQVLNNLDGVLVGISTKSANYTGSFQDYDSVLIKVWNGGAEPTLIKELKVPYVVGSSPTSSHPQATINPRVNFVYQNRLYFSVNLVPGDGTHPARYGLWSVGKNINGEWTVTQERVATNSNTETGVIAAAISGDFVSMAHTSEGTLTYTLNGQQSSSTYAATSVYESAVNPGMSDNDKVLQKKIDNVSIRCQPLPSGASVVLKYRVDSSGSDSDWSTLFTFNTAGATEADSGSLVLTDGYNFEFRLESTGGAVIDSFAYRYHELSTGI